MITIPPFFLLTFGLTASFDLTATAVKCANSKVKRNRLMLCIYLSMYDKLPILTTDADFIILIEYVFGDRLEAGDFSSLSVLFSCTPAVNCWSLSSEKLPLNIPVVTTGIQFEKVDQSREQF